MEIVINTDLSISGTKLTIDGKEVNKKTNVVGITMYARSPIKDDEYDDGYIEVAVTSVDSEGVTETKTYRKNEYNGKKVPMGVKIKDFMENFDNKNVIRYLGKNVDTKVVEIADKISNHCKENKIVCPDKDVLYNRSLASLKDKADDLGIKLKDEVE